MELGLGRGKKLTTSARRSPRASPIGACGKRSGAAPSADEPTRGARARRRPARGLQRAEPEYRPSRFDYWSFRARVGSLPEPNYLPWVMHRETLPDGARALVVCRFADSAFPLRYFVRPPEIPEALESEDNPRDAADYVGAVEQAFEAWQKAIGRPVRFERVDRREDAAVEIRLVAQVQEIDEGAVLGVVKGEAELCRVTASGATPDRVEIEFSPRRRRSTSPTRWGC